MLLNESVWIKKTLSEHFSENDFPLLNIGSSTKEFREIVQPHIDQNVFTPLRQRGLKLIHTDIKLDSGVDVAGDINEANFQDKLKALGVKSVLCSNLLEHLSDPHQICKSMLELVERGRLLLITVPYSFPYHKDPIDTLFRPNIEQLHHLFQGTEIVTAQIVEETWTYKMSLVANKKYLMIMLVRWLLPFYKYSEWRYMISDLFNWNKKHASTCILLRKL